MAILGIERVYTGMSPTQILESVEYRAYPRYCVRAVWIAEDKVTGEFYESWSAYFMSGDMIPREIWDRIPKDGREHFRNVLD